MTNKLVSKFTTDSKRWLNVYFTAGMPHINDTSQIVLALQEAGVDMIEVGFPYSDPLADGHTIQASNQKALDNGITLQKIFEDLTSISSHIHIPMYGMLYFNQILQFGKEKFCKMCTQAGIKGLIVPDLPVEYYEKLLKPSLDKYGLKITFLITPQTTTQRIKIIQKMTTGWIYIVSSNATTGKSNQINSQQIEYFEKIKNYRFKHPTMIGFGIHDADSFDTACKYANGAIIGSAFINQLLKDPSNKSIHQFVKEIIGTT